MKTLPYDVNLTTKELYEQLNKSNYSIGKLNGILMTLPNPDLVLSIATLRESKDSSEIENIITTYDELYKELIIENKSKTTSKKVLNYKNAIYTGKELLDNNDYISLNMIKEIHYKLTNTKTGFRKLPGTIIKNDVTGEVVHTPPQSYDELIYYMNNFEEYFNNISDNDPLIDMALTHYQFETIHPFYDGNGRTGRILNVLYLILRKKIDLPILYLSKYINDNREQYYRLFNEVNKDIKNIDKFILYMLKGIEVTSNITINIINDIKELMDLTKTLLKQKLPTIYNPNLLTHLFKNMYTKNKLYMDDLNVSRNTATTHLKQLEKEGFLISEKVGREVVYKNVQLFNIVNNS